MQLSNYPFRFNEDGAKVATSYIVSVTVPKGHSLEGKYEYYVKRDSEDKYVYVTVDAENRDITATPVELTALVEYTVTIKNGESNFDEGQEVSVNGTKYTVGSDGTFKISLRPEVDRVTIEIAGYVIDGTITFDKEGKTITATFNPYSNELEVGVAKEFEDASYDNPVTLELQVSESGNYTFNIDSSSRVIVNVYYLENGEEVGVWEEVAGYPLEAGIKYYVMVYANWGYGSASGTVTVTKA